MKFFKSDFTGNLINLNKYHFLINAFLINLILLYKRMKRTPAIVKKIYDKERSLIKIDNILDKKKDFILINDEIIFNSRLKIRRIISKKIQKHISKDQYDLIIEVGSGTGINLFNLCKNNIKKKFLGIELSKKSVDLCNLINIELKKKI
jgi:dihydroxyacetone kinase-like predicted kinase